MVLNRFPLWKNLLIVVLLAIGTVYALPNVFGEDPAIQITAARGGTIPATLQDTVRTVLSEHALPTKGMAMDAQTFLVRFRDEDQQAKAKTLLKAALGSDYVVALNLAPAAPAWLASLGAQPMKLGLDLRGGIRFLLQVDMQTAYQRRAQSILAEARTQLRKQRIRYSAAGVNTKAVMSLRFKTAEQGQQALTFLQKQFPTLLLQQTTDRGESVVTGELGQALRKQVLDATMEQSMAILRNRVNELGVAEAVVQRQGKSRIGVELPGVQDSARAKAILGKTATLEFMLVDDEHDVGSALATGRAPAGTRLYFDAEKRPYLLKKRVILTGDAVVGANSGFDEYNRPEVSIRLGGNVNHFYRVTRDNIGKRLGAVYIETRFETVKKGDKTERRKRVIREVISAATINSALGARFRITGLQDSQEARNLALLLRAGALPVAIDYVEERTIGPSLGAANIAMGIHSVELGLSLVLGFMLVYYSLFGLVADLALLANLILLVAVMSLIGVTLTLPGIAGIVLTLGMAVDANVLIFERVREELRNGASPQASIHAGYEKAFVTIVDANVTTFIAALVLLTIGSGPVKGFAVTLCIGLVTSMFTAVTFSRALINAWYGGRRVEALQIG